MFKQIIAVLRKEILDARRDYKALMPALLMPVLFAGLTYGGIWFFVSLQDQPQSYELAVQGAERAEPLMDALREAGISITSAPADIGDAVASGVLDMVLIIPDSFNQEFRNQKRASVDLVWDVSRMDSHTKVNFVRQQIQRWAATTGALRLLLRGHSPEVAQVLVINDVNVATDQRMVSRMVAGLPMVLLLIAFASGAGMCSEMAAGERENRTLEPLLINPVSHSALFAGKWLAALCITFVITLVGAVLQLAAINLAPTGELGLHVALGSQDLFLILVILLPVIILATALALLVSFLSKSFKDAQSYNQLLMLVPVVPGVYALWADSGSTTAGMLVPLLGPQLLIADIFSGEAINSWHISMAGLVSLILALASAVVAIFLMRQER
jgi:sodium transport system permease protein